MLGLRRKGLYKIQIRKNRIIIAYQIVTKCLKVHKFKIKMNLARVFIFLGNDRFLQLKPSIERSVSRIGGPNGGRARRAVQIR